MTVSNPTNLATFTGNGVTTEFPYTFKIPDANSVEVTLYEIATEEEGEPLAPELYDITGLGEEDGGEVTYPLSGDPLASTHKINIRRVVELEQGLNLTNQSAYFPEELEEQLDRTVMMIQQLNEEVERSVKVKLGSGDDPDALIEGALNTLAASRAAVDDAEDARDAAVVAQLAAEAAAGSMTPVETQIHNATVKDTPDEADEFGFWDSVSEGLCKFTLTNLKATLKTYFDTLYQPAGGSTGFAIGQYITLAGTTLPEGCVWAYGQTLLIADVPDYFAEVGTLYGGDGVTTVGVPDRRGRVGAGKDDMGGTSANRLTNQTGGIDGDTLGAVGGAETHTLTVAQLATHNHPGATRSSDDYLDDTLGSDGYLVNKDTNTTGNAGGDEPHNNVQPTIIENVAIYVGGIY